ncbi:MAG: hypothetical protein HQK91_03705 [Nitrospirae bacterium]|nr:hypothetical protein [Nitrospirota bacterium]
MKIKIFKIVMLVLLISVLPISTYFASAADIVSLEVSAGFWYEIPTFGLALDFSQIIQNMLNNQKLPQLPGNTYTTTSNYTISAPFKSELAFMARAKFEHPLPVIPNIYVLYTPVILNGSITLNGSVNVKDSFGHSATTNITRNVASMDTSMNMFDIAFYSGIPFLKAASLGWFSLDLGLDFKVLSVPTALLPTGTTLPINVIPIPTIYAAFQVSPAEMDDFSFEGEARILPAFIISDITSQLNASIYDLLGRVKYNFLKPAYVSVGYRYQAIAVGSQGIAVSVKTQGPFAEVGTIF